MPKNENIVYRTEDYVCKECDKPLDENRTCNSCFMDDLGLIKDSDGSWHIDPSLLEH